MIRNQQASDTRARKRTDRTSQQRTERQPTDIPRASRRNLAQHADLRAETADVGEAAECVGGDEARAGREVGVGGVGL